MSKLRIIECFGGIGALSFALFYNHFDFEVVQYIEKDKKAVKAYNLIHNTNFVVSDINEIDKFKEADLLFAGFPCQDISKANTHNNKGLEGSRSSLIFKLLEILEKSNKPEIVIFENVWGLEKDKLYIDIEFAMSQMGFFMDQLRIDSINFGSPCYRKRLYLIFRKKWSEKIYLQREKPIILKNMIDFNKYESWKINKEGYIPIPINKTTIFIKPMLEKGKGILKNGMTYRKKNNEYKPILYRLNENSISLNGFGPTITTKTEMCFLIRERDRARTIHWEECFKIMGFRFSRNLYILLGSEFSLSNLYKFIGNSNDIHVLEKIIKAIYWIN